MIMNQERPILAGIQNTEMNLATASSRFELRWKNRTMTLGDFVRKLSEPTRTPETVEEFHALPKAKQDEIKDVGGYVGGTLKGGKRSNSTVANRQIVTLDLDHPGKEHLDKITDQIRAALGTAAFVVHSTHKHTPGRPRLRVIPFLDRPVYPDEYQAIARQLAARIGIEWFDDSTYQPHRLMYWPSIPTDAEYLWIDNTGQGAELVDADAILASYGPDEAWTDTALWSTSSRQAGILERQMKQQADPLTKKGIVGAFCRCFNIHEAIKEFLPETYRHEGGERYTFTEGSSSKGLVVYDGKFAYSNHATDPASNVLCNSFDLVRMHKFADLDQDARDGTPTHKLPSYLAMQEWAAELKPVKIEVVRSITDQFEAVEGQICADENDQEDANEWMDRLHIGKNGTIKSTFYNASLILEHDSKWKGLVWRNDHTTFKEKGREGDEWKDDDTLIVRKDLAERFKIDITTVIATDALDHVASFNTYHPVREYLKGLKWDGVKRAERLWIDYLGEEDNAYTRETALKWLLAAVYRIFCPGYKFDYVPVLEGQQGIMKTTMCRTLAVKPEWFGELNTVDNQKAVEQMKGKWIMEMGELELNNRHELEQVKSFISGTETCVRLSYKREPGIYKRQCVFIGTTNQKEYLKDSTGNRRWWPLKASERFREGGDGLDMKALAANRDQIWAEVVEYFYDPDSTTELSKAAIQIAMQRQKEKMFVDEWIGIIEAWLQLPARVDRYNCEDNGVFSNLNNEVRTETRDRVCAVEIWEDCLKMKGTPATKDSRRIGRIMDSMPGWTRSDSIRLGRYGRQRGWILAQ